jgi:hypothetical protein
VEVNTFIYKVRANYALNDDEYTEVLRQLQDEARAHCETYSVGLLHKYEKTPYPKVTVEEVEDEDYLSS